MHSNLIHSFEEILKSIKVLWQKGFLAAGDGNFSVKDEGEVWITPSGKKKNTLKPKDFVLSNSREASSELAMHLKVYEACPKAKVVFHAHPSSAIAWSLISNEPCVPEDILSELVLSCGTVPIVPYARPGSKSMGEHLAPYLPSSRVLILKHHGALTWGESVEEALRGMERLEHTCDILLKALSTGLKLQTLPKEELTWLKEKRQQLGERIL